MSMCLSFSFELSFMSLSFYHAVPGCAFTFKRPVAGP